MTYLKDIKNRLTDMLSGVNNINTVVDDLLLLNNPDVVYGCAVIEHESTVFSENDNGTIATYNFTIFVADLDVGNTTDIQSSAEQVIMNLVSTLREDYLIDEEITVTPFKHKFTALASGCYADIGISDFYNTECK